MSSNMKLLGITGVAIAMKGHCVTKHDPIGGHAKSIKIETVASAMVSTPTSQRVHVHSDARYFL